VVSQVAKRKRLRKNNIVAVSVVAVCAVAVLLWNDSSDKSEESKLKVQFDDIVGRGFEALASNDLYNAERIFSSFFDKKGNDLNSFNKVTYYHQLLVRSFYGDILFRKNDLEKAEVVLRPIFKDENAMNHFASSGTSQDEILLSYIKILKVQKNDQEMLRIFNLFYHKNGNATEVLREFGDLSSLRAIAGEVFFNQGENKRVIGLLRPFFKDPKLLTELSIKQQAMIRWYYGHSLFCEDKIDRVEEIFAPFFNENFKPTKLFEILDQEDQIICRTQYAQALLKGNNSEKIVKLLEVFFDKNGELLPQFKNSHFQDVIRGIYGQALGKQNRFFESNRVLSWFVTQKKFIKNFDQEEIDLLTSLYRDINRMWVKNW
jgi:hypothetical protein